MVNWKTNLVIIWISQLLSIAGFFFALPFGPYYIQELGVHDPVKIKFWVALFGAGPPLSLAIFSPIWGTLADRYGRRLMLLRANFGGMIILCLMGTVQSVEALIALRLVQGVFTGTVIAAQAMVAAYTPERRSGVALGSLSAAVYMGSMTGAFVGGMFAEYFGYRYAFFGSGTLLLVAGLLVLFGAKEDFIKPYRLLLVPPGSWRVSSLVVWRTFLTHLKLRSFQPSLRVCFWFFIGGLKPSSFLQWLASA